MLVLLELKETIDDGGTAEAEAARRGRINPHGLRDVTRRTVYYQQKPNSTFKPVGDEKTSRSPVNSFRFYERVRE